MKDLKKVIEYYEAYDENSRLTRDNVHKIEHITTLHYLENYIKPGMRILEVGAGTGTYSYHFANKDCDVTAFELVSKNIDILKQKLKRNKPIQIIQGDARDLSCLNQEEPFDVVLCLGPLYHLQDDIDKQKCISECIKHTKDEGLLAFAYINQYMAYINTMMHDLSYLKKEIIDQALLQFNLGNSFQFLNPEKMENLLDGYPISIKHHIGADGLNYVLREQLNQMSDDEFQIYLYYHLKTCETTSLLGYSTHGLVIGEKNGN